MCIINVYKSRFISERIAGTILILSVYRVGGDNDVAPFQ